MVESNTAQKLELELRRGVIVLAALTRLREPCYGYELRQTLADHGLLVEEGTLYPLLRRLESQGVLSSEWRAEGGPPKRYYVLSSEGRKLFEDLTVTWQSLNEAMGSLLSEGEHDVGN